MNLLSHVKVSNDKNVYNGDLDLRNIEWLMDSVDLEQVLNRLEVRTVGPPKNDEIWGYCPDHHIFVGREPSDPKWSINTKTGKTNCFTEHRGSNLVWIVHRLKSMTARESVEWILDGSVESLSTRIKHLKRTLNGLVPNKEVSMKEGDLEKFVMQMSNAELDKKSVSFLSKNDVQMKTAADFGCVEFDSGIYKNRLVFPVKNRESDVVGFIATDVLGKEEWLNVNKTIFDKKINEVRTTVPSDYRKVLYPLGFGIGSYLIGTDMYEGSSAILVEGARDVMKLHQENFRGALGVGGAKITEEQIKQLAFLMPKKVILMFDGDEAGKRGALESAKKLSYFFDSVFIANLDTGVDPKDLKRAEVLFYLKYKTVRFIEKKDHN
jgi:hypothetical protein